MGLELNRQARERLYIAGRHIFNAKGLVNKLIINYKTLLLLLLLYALRYLFAKKDRVSRSVLKNSNECREQYLANLIYPENSFDLYKDILHCEGNV